VPPIAGGVARHDHFMAFVLDVVHHHPGQCQQEIFAIVLARLGDDGVARLERLLVVSDGARASSAS